VDRTEREGPTTRLAERPKGPIKNRDGSGNTWARRGAQPVWLREKLKAGAKVMRQLLA
jgi:DNA-binding protein H-NS